MRLAETGDFQTGLDNDLANKPLSREFVMLPRRSTAYWPKGHELAYFEEQHPDLENKFLILQNLGLIRDITYNNSRRYLISEDLADYLIATNAAP